jgi:uncharacterized membrane protein YdjX (TVP38/TMEM64 family)
VNGTNSQHSKTQATPLTEPSKIDKKIVGLVVVLAVCAGWFFARDFLTIEALAAQENQLRAFQEQHEWLVLGIAFVGYVAVTGLSLPGAAVMTLILGWFLGFWRALVLVSFASTAGATLAFLLSRYFLSDFIHSKFGAHLEKFNQALDREGAFYLFTLRLIPAVPFFVINVVMGLTSIRVRTYWWVSQIGMLAGTCVFVYAGTSIPSLDQVANPALLRSSDITDWPGFIGRIRSADSPSFERLKSLLPTEIVDTFQSDSPISNDQKLRTTNAINRLLKQSNFALDEPWQPSNSNNDDQKEITAINRSVLVMAFPQHVLPPQPILSKQLLLAFVLLGFFPIIVKKLMQRFKKEEPS